MSAPDISEPFPLAGSVYLETNDPEVARREMSKILAPHAMIPAGSRGTFHARHHHARLSGLSVNYIQYRPGATISADLSRRFFLVHYVLSGQCQLGPEIGGRMLQTGDVAVINPTEPFSLQTSDDCGQIVIKLETDILTDAGRRRFSISQETPIRFSPTETDTPCGSIGGIIELICSEAERIGQGGGGAKTEQLLAELLAVSLIEFLPHNVSAALSQRTSESGIAPWYVKRVEEFLELHPDKPLRISDMTAVAGVSERTLFNGFRDWRGMSPKSYLKAIRLDRVRTELLGLNAKSRNVGDIAREYGFRHMGNFARDYSDRFGERPSETFRFSLPPNT